MVKSRWSAQHDDGNRCGAHTGRKSRLRDRLIDEPSLPGGSRDRSVNTVASRIYAVPWASRLPRTVVRPYVTKISDGIVVSDRFNEWRFVRGWHPACPASGIALGDNETRPMSPNPISGKLFCHRSPHGRRCVVSPMGSMNPEGLDLGPGSSIAYVAEYGSRRLLAVDLLRVAVTPLASSLPGPLGVALELPEGCRGKFSTLQPQGGNDPAGGEPGH